MNKDFAQALQQICTRGTAHDFALFRLPESDTLHLILSDSAKTLVLTSAPEALRVLPPLQGFLIAPFTTCVETPQVLIPATHHYTTSDLTTLMQRFMATDRPLSHDVCCDATYAAAFAACMPPLQEGTLQKVVLSHTQHYPTPSLTRHDMIAYWARACHEYPHQYVALWHTAVTGMWLVATPELLLHSIGQRAQTMALAGTMPRTATEAPVISAWSEKNRTEQALVTSYIKQVLQPLVHDIQQTGPYTTAAARLWHLRTDLHFSLQKDFYTVLQSLHPTPAVCGLPTPLAAAHLARTEQHARKYYAGYSGWVANSEKCCYVSLRCMQALSQGILLYAGGGLLPSSELSQEWHEVNSKMDTMRYVLAHPQ